VRCAPRRSLDDTVIADVPYGSVHQKKIAQRNQGTMHIANPGPTEPLDATVSCDELLAVMPRDTAGQLNETLRKLAN